MSRTDAPDRSAAADHLDVRREGRAGRITLRREKALNALTHDMVRTLDATLQRWEGDDAIALVVLDGAGDRAFCAGGDVTSLYRLIAAGDLQEARRFFRDEYRLNARIADYPKPVVALMDRITMGGGIGLAGHASHRVVTERSQLALPECAIGLVPDVGATHLLAHAPGHVGEYLGVSGQRLDADAAVYAGFADHVVASDSLSALSDELIGSGDGDCVATFASAAEPSTLAGRRAQIDACFGAASLSEAVAGLRDGEADTGTWSADTLRQIDAASPLSGRAAFQLIRQARGAPGVDAALTREFRVVSRLVESGDFVEGIRAALIDRDRRPVWKHASIDEVPGEVLQRLSEAAPGGDLQL